MQAKTIHFCKLWVDDFFYGYVPVDYAMDRLTERKEYMKRFVNSMPSTKVILCGVLVKTSIGHVVEMKITQDVISIDEMMHMMKRNRRKDGKQFREFVFVQNKRG